MTRGLSIALSRRLIDRAVDRRDQRCGLASSIRTLIDLVAGPLASMLGFSLQRPIRVSDDIWAATFVHDHASACCGHDVGAPLERMASGRRLASATEQRGCS
jgi:hypothetical protein